MLELEDSDSARIGAGGGGALSKPVCGGWGEVPLTLESKDIDRGGSNLDSLCMYSGGAPQCCANNDRLSSIGVKILCDLLRLESGFGCGSGGLWKAP